TGRVEGGARAEVRRLRVACDARPEQASLPVMASGEVLVNVRPLRCRTAIEAAILDGLGDVRRAHLGVAGEVGDRAGDAQNARVGACGQAKALARELEEPAAGRSQAAGTPHR